MGTASYNGVSYDAPSLRAAHAKIDEGLRTEGYAFSQSGVGSLIKSSVDEWAARDHPDAFTERSITSNWYWCKTTAVS